MQTINAEALNTAVKSAVPHGAEIDPDMLEYITESALSAVEGGGTDEEVQQTIEPFLETFLEEDQITAFCSDFMKALKFATAKDEETENVSQDKYIVDLPEIILGFGGKMLLNQTALRFLQGHRYALVGHNGAGKTTLMTRLARNDIIGFPQDLRCVYVKHEILTDQDTPVVDFLTTEEKLPKEECQKALEGVGFSPEMLVAPVSSLSGGWRMKLALARSLLYKADMLLLDEPTNHLDVQAVAWLADYLNSLTETTIVVVSHDHDFMQKVVTDVILVHSKKLYYFHSDFKEFQRTQRQLSAPATFKSAGQSGLAGGGVSRRTPSPINNNGVAPPPQVQDDEDPDFKPQFKFPNPGLLDGVQSRTRVVMKMKDVQYTYNGASQPTLSHVSLKLTMGSKIAILGENGAGKSTLMSILVGEFVPDEGVGTVTKHHNLRVAHIAQHSMHQLEAHLEGTLIEYMRQRFKSGTDKDLNERATTMLTQEVKDQMAVWGAIVSIEGRVLKNRKLEYQIKRNSSRDMFWWPLAKIEKECAPYVLALVRQYDEKVAAAAAGTDRRETTAEAILEHLRDFGLADEYSKGKIERLSGGQRSRLVIAAAMWNRPHVICLDEPTNYLDLEALDSLAMAITKFRGAIVLISHSERFVNDLCNEHWIVENGTLRQKLNPIKS
eukprot:CFRG7657T1